MNALITPCLFRAETFYQISAGTPRKGGIMARAKLSPNLVALQARLRHKAVYPVARPPMAMDQGYSLPSVY